MKKILLFIWLSILIPVVTQSVVANESNSDFSVSIEKNFQNRNLQGMCFEGASLEGANFERADLEETNLYRANIKNANFKRAELEYATWIDGQICGAGSVGACW